MARSKEKTDFIERADKAVSTLGKTILDFSIDTRIGEIRRTIRLLEARIAELQAIKAADLGNNPLPDLDKL